jgi:hypothetical protein
MSEKAVRVGLAEEYAILNSIGACEPKLRYSIDSGLFSG